MIDLKTETPVLISELAKKLNVSRGTIENWIVGQSASNRRLDAMKIGGRTYTSYEAVERFSQPVKPHKERTKKPERVARMETLRKRRGRPRKVIQAAETPEAIVQQQTSTAMPTTAPTPSQDFCLIECD